MDTTRTTREGATMAKRATYTVTEMMYTNAGRPEQRVTLTIDATTGRVLRERIAR